ncbi:hypothetical protein LSUB1_G000873 [Lachnellula subtilissima]|uniref:Uncharacterized protein n=1 Tax=Lachnellula subtilissima TaxID=602034 RepID=A0A8H8S2L8_9HELO|nr:hypothetical protein LSUB1_G000873 [Lachnellula subtilissima]
MKSRAGPAPRKRRRLDKDEVEDEDKDPEEIDDRNRPGALVRTAIVVEDDELAASVATQRTPDSEPSDMFRETIGPAPGIDPSTGHDSSAEKQCRSVSRPPLSGYDLDRLNYHVGLRDFGTSLQKAANAVFASDRRSRYTRVSALLLSWEDEDPRLPVSLEIRDLKHVFITLYGFEVQEWQIPAVDSHVELNMRVLQFLKDGGSGHLKIVYYAGHGKLSNHGQAIWTSHRNECRERPPTVKWSGIQNALEESPSDVLILLDCCASGLSNTDEGGKSLNKLLKLSTDWLSSGNGVTELLAACAFNSIANGVGLYSFTHALISQLQKLARMPAFTVGYLYNLIFAEIQSLQIDDAQRKKAPIHLVLSQDHRLPRSIRISAKPPHPNINRPSIPSFPGRNPLGSTTWNYDPASLPQDSLSSQSSGRSSGVFSPDSNDGASSSSSISQIPEYPRLLFSIRISEDIKPNELSPELFAEWLGTLPLSTNSVRVEAGFASDSTLLMVSMPVAFLGYLPNDDPAITMLGVTRSTNLFSTVEDQRPLLPHVTGIKADDVFDDQANTQDSGFEEFNMFYDNFENTSPQGLDRQKGADATCGPQYARTSHKSAQKQVPKSNSPLRHSMSMPAAATSSPISSPTVRKTLFHTEETMSLNNRYQISLLEKELLIGQLRDDNAKLENSKNALPDDFVDG